MTLLKASRRLAIAALALLAPVLAVAVEVRFVPVAEDVFAHVGDTGARTAENEGLNANIGLVVTPEKAVDDGGDLSAAVKSFDSQPFTRLLHAAELMPGNGSRAYLELERE